ncbi:MAG: NAD(P)H-dependent oxidoreductase [Pegethrix bostrychoides GSE-TBD4-15B]|uniref:NAD(P)H-dependent oxidoreductase n=1 Tax=Pegethrix bostrychoides GSE-TBD4-15B TaxID=2839662 RepID=A0A951P7T4_9CYAN|nr:NAD(P)H-dependent oxidoreductase [Pegethrix bostrychoides GSE-TBD4-15B]
MSDKACQTTASIRRFSVTTPEQLLQQLHWRYATKKFDPTKAIPDDLWQTLEKSLVLTPSSFGLQPWKFVVVRDPAIRQQLVEHSWGQSQVGDASHTVVFAIKKGLSNADVDHYIARLSEVQGTPLEVLQGFSDVIKGFLEKMPDQAAVDAWAAKQVYIALGQFMAAAAMLEVDTCPMEGINPPKYDEILGLAEQGYGTIVICPAGYRAADDKSATRPKVRFPAEEVVMHVG